MTLTMAQRAAKFALAFPKYPASWPRVVKERGRDVLYATWVLGNDYRNKTEFYGAYPPSYLERAMALFPEMQASETLHAFSGALPSGEYFRLDLDLKDEYRPEMRGNVKDARALVDRVLSPHHTFQMIYADPPYSEADAKQYGTAMVNRRLATAALAEVTRVGGYLAWLDTVWPIHRKTQWVTVGRILVQRSTNHRVRVLTIFERVA